MAALIISQKRHALDGLLSPQSKSILHRQSRVQQPSRAQIADSHHQTKPESLTNWSLQGVPRDSFATDPVPSNCAHGARDRAAQAGPIIRRCARLILLIAANLAIFFIWTFPANQTTNNWTVVPENWNELRIQWEYSHAVNAIVMFVALACVVVSVLRQPSATGITVRGG